VRFLACAATFHLIDYLDRTQRDKYRRESPPFAAVDRPGAIWGEAVWDLSRWEDSVGGVTVAGEHDRDLQVDVKEAAAFLRSKVPP
jgi:hypothetical protein